MAETDKERRSKWTAEVVELGDAKGPLYDSLTPEARLKALAALNARVFGTRPQTSRSERKKWPAQVFELHPK